MELGWGMSKSNWKTLLDLLRETEGVTLTYFAETDKDGLFVCFKYAIFEYQGKFYYIQEGDYGFTITAYRKISPYERLQMYYPEKITSFDELIKYISTIKKERPIRGAHTQRIYLTELYDLSDGRTSLYKLENNLAGNREKEILSHLDRIEMIRNSGGYKVLRFWDSNGGWFDYECNNKRITG